MWKKFSVSLIVALNLVLHPAHSTHAQEQVAAPEDQKPEDQKPDSSQSTSSTTSTAASKTGAAASAGGMSIGAVVGVVGGIAAVASGGGSSSSSPTSRYSSTVSGAYAAEYAANDALEFQNILSLNDYGYTGSGIKVSVVDSGIDASHQEFDGKTIYGVVMFSGTLGFGRKDGQALGRDS